MTLDIEEKEEIVTSLTKAEIHLSGLDENWKRLVKLVGNYRPNRSMEKKEPYEELIRAVASQQLHSKAANAIFNRFKSISNNGQFPTPEEIRDMDFETMRACGFSARKIDSLKSIAEATISGLIPTKEEAERLSNEELIERLTQIKGIGRWTVEMLLIFSLNRNDVMPADDLSIRNGYRYLHRLPKIPTKMYVLKHSEICAPFRTAAAWYLWKTSKLADYTKPVRPKKH